MQDACRPNSSSPLSRIVRDGLRLGRSKGKASIHPFVILAPLLLLAGCATALVSVQTLEPFSTVVISGSMLPLLQIAQVINVVPANYDQLKVGQIVAYRPYFSRSPFNYVHMLMAKRGDNWVVQGINNLKPDDSFLTRGNFVGLVLLGEKSS